jgi:hypothetical protein
MTDKYYDSYIDARGFKREYSYFEGQIYSPPSSPRKSGSINMSLSNNLEMKVRSAGDTIGELKKVMLLNNLSLSTNYNIFADSLNWSNVSFNGRTNLFKKNLGLNFAGSLDPYAVDANGSKIDQWEFDKSGKLARLSNFRLSLSTNFGGGEGERETGGSAVTGGLSREGAGEGSEEPQETRSLQEIPVGYEYFQFPWNLSMHFSLNYRQRFNREKQDFESEIRQTIGINGNFDLTPKWKFSFSTNYDIQEDKIGPSQLSINRDLHCFSMSFTWVPVGYRRMYNFTIKANSSLLQDALKFRKDRTFYDNF